MLHAATDSVPTSPMLTSDVPDPASSSSSNPFDQYKVIRRHGSVAVFGSARISIALTKAFIAVNGGQGAASRRQKWIDQAQSLNICMAGVSGRKYVGAAILNVKLASNRGQLLP